MQGRQFLYFLTNASNQFATFQNGILEWVGSPMPLQFTPDGWQDISILTERNKKYFGLDRTYGAPQSFVEDGAEILKAIFYNQGIEEVVYLVILEQNLFLDAVNYGYYYTLLCKCEVDLSTIVHEAEKVTASLLEGDITKYVKANEGTTYDIPLQDSPEAVNLLLDGIKLFATAHYKNLGITLQSTGPSSGGLPITFLNKEGDQANILNQSSSIIYPKVPFIKSVKGSITVHLKGKLIWAVNDNVANANVGLQKLSAADPEHTFVDVFHFNTGPGNATGEYPIDMDIVLNEGEGLWFQYVLGSTAPHANPQLLFQESDIDISYTTRLAATQIKVMKPLDLWKKITEKLTEGKFTADSTLLQNLDPFVLFGSGDGIRQIPGSFIKTSLSDFFGFMRMRYGAGIGVVNGVLRMEKMQYWANNSNPVRLKNASGLKVSVAAEYLIPNFKIGYQNKLDNQALGNINGRYEFCMTQQYITPELRSTASADFSCNYNAGMYVIENTRLNSAGKTTTDGDSDNDTFVFHTLPTATGGGTVTISTLAGPVTFTVPPFFILDRTVNPYTTGLLDQESAFNIRLSPKHCVFGMGAYLRSCLTNQDGKKIKFTTADKNVDLKVTMPGGQIINEREDVTIGDLDPAFFKNYVLEFTCEPPTTEEMLSPVREFYFDYGITDIPLSGFDIKTGTQPADNRQQVFTLLAGADCDVTRLTEVNE